LQAQMTIFSASIKNKLSLTTYEETRPVTILEARTALAPPIAPDSA